MEKLYILKYIKGDEDSLSQLIVADPYKTLPNGNKEIITMIIGDYADELFHELIKEGDDNECDDNR